MPRLHSLASAPRRHVASAAARPAPVAIRAAPPRAPLLKAGCSCGGLCPACRTAALAGPDHAAEREADAVATQVMEMSDPSPVAAAEPQTLRCQPEEEQLQRQPEDEEEEALQLQPEEEGEEELVQAKAEPLSGGLVAAPTAGLSAGRPMPERLRAFFEPRFGRSFAEVRIHDGPDAQRRAKSLRAQAFAYGRDIVFGPGRYAPETIEGRRLIAHELAHVVQQGRAVPAVQRWAVSGDGAVSDASGDTLWGLARSVSGNGRDWTCTSPRR